MIAECINMTGFIAVNQSRCSRIRFNKSSCRKCFEVCSPQAIKIDEEGLGIDQSACTECMLCVSSCPTDVFKIRGFDFFSIVDELKKIHAPVISCNVADNIEAHIRTACLGFFSEIHFAFISLVLTEPIQLNLTACNRCVNGPVVSALEKTFEHLEKMLSKNYTSHIKLIRKISDLNYQPISYTLRNFFRAIRYQALEKPIRALDSLEAGKKQTTYADKLIPETVVLLNRVMHEAPKSLKHTILESFYFDIKVNTNCDSCFACVGVLLIKRMNGNNFIGYDAFRIVNGDTVPFARRVGFEPQDWQTEERIGNFSISQKGKETANHWICEAASRNCIVIDEVGSLEVRGGGLYESVQYILNQVERKDIFLVVQLRCVDQVCSAFQIKNYRMLSASTRGN